MGMDMSVENGGEKVYVVGITKTGMDIGTSMGIGPTPARYPPYTHFVNSLTVFVYVGF